MSDEKDPGDPPVDSTVAVAEPPDLPELETPASLEDSAQPAGQEPAPDKDAEGDAPPAEGDAEQAETEDPFASLDTLIQNIAENDPDRLADAIEKLPEEHRARYLGPDEERVKLANENSAKQWTEAVETAQKTAASYNDQNITSQLQEPLAQMAQVATDRAKAYREDREGSTANVVDANSWAPILGRQLGTIVTNAKTAQESQTRLEILSDFVGTLQEVFPVKLSHADMQKLQSIDSTSIKEWMGEYAGTYIEALQRKGAAPNTEDSESAKELTAQIATINEQFSGKGRKATKGELPAASSQPKNEQEMINWHATGKWTTAQKREWLAKQ
ncbi:hypothetical protein LCGC14_2267270 [marine sediment metagenome]|uniref:Uncharacterized protein n=1 Tax=marine sediment metagenome TaxID=412755 RepID=A0A0F9DKC0_9ZZZZ